MFALLLTTVLAQKISDLPALTTPATNDLAMVVDVSDTSVSATGRNKQITLSNLGKAIPPTIADTGADHFVTLASGENNSADRVLTLNLSNAARTLNVTGTATVSQDYSTAGSPIFTALTLGTSETPVVAGKLGVYGAGSSFGTFRDTTTDSEVFIGPVGTIGIVGTSTNHNLAIRQNNTTIATVTSGGIEIGTAEATVVSNSRLGVFRAGDAGILTRDTTNDVELVYGAFSAVGLIGTATNHQLDFRTNNTVRLSLAASGEFDIKVVPKFSGLNTTGAGAALLGTNCPATTVAAPYTWIKVTTSDGSTAYVPCWK